MIIILSASMALSARWVKPSTGITLLADSAFITEFANCTLPFVDSCHVLPANNANSLIGHPNLLGVSESNAVQR